MASPREAAFFSTMEESESEQGRDDLFDEGNLALAIGNLEDAAVAYKRVVDLDPEFFDGWHAYGMVLMKLERYKEAIGAGLQATTLQPNDLLAWTALSQMYVANEQIAEAEDAKQKATILGIGGKIVREG